ncbi:TIGR01212 family radical SAM protein [Marinobacterium aestuariivivens]|uniref:TIGR01212 family radical SAM protein n=1 Tax=Marinobacterium aestuariivivens TaxID=1698799 RepID=A0ABW1ZVE6_9GAMM
MNLTQYVNTFGGLMRARHGCKVHKVSINAAFTCPNRDSTKGIGGCTFCNNASFNPNTRRIPGVEEQVRAGQAVVGRQMNARRFIAYFQAYTNTYGDVGTLAALYDSALSVPGVIGLSVGTRPDCVPDAVLDLLASYRDRGYEVWLELGLQSASDAVLRRVNRGHDVACYRDAMKRARRRGLQVCTHLIVGLPGEAPEASLGAAQLAIEQGTDGLKLHPLHVVKGTRMAREWKQGQVPVLSQSEYVDIVCSIIRAAPEDLSFHRLTGTASRELLLAPDWCAHKWSVLNLIGDRLAGQAAGESAIVGNSSRRIEVSPIICRG